jgi:hypothetical protein
MEAAEMVKLMSDMFRDQAPMTAAEASAEILDGVRATGDGGSSSATTPASSTRPCAPHPEIAYESLTLGDLTSGRAGTPFAADA